MRDGALAKNTINIIYVGPIKHTAYKIIYVGF